MGFPSPAMDYQEQRLTIDLLCGLTTAGLLKRHAVGPLLTFP
jgi:hypothetical protein